MAGDKAVESDFRWTSENGGAFVVGILNYIFKAR
jgi:hypothetical protein